jgi:hypothetical protein
MKTEKSTIKRKLELTQDIITDLGIHYLKKWTDTELKKYITQPVIIPQGTHGFLLGTYKITGIHSSCWRVELSDNKVIHHFTSKHSAFMYCINVMKNKHSAAQSLLTLDAKLGNLETDIAYYENFLHKGKQKDAFKYTVVLNRCIDAKMKRKALIEILKKTLNTAKYLNIGKQPL